MPTRKSKSEPLLASFGGPNLCCTACGQAFYSESAGEMAGRACGTKGCAGTLVVLATPENQKKA
jgi:hypothetical protein